MTLNDSGAIGLADLDLDRGIARPAVFQPVTQLRRYRIGRPDGAAEG